MLYLFARHLRAMPSKCLESTGPELVLGSPVKTGESTQLCWSPQGRGGYMFAGVRASQTGTFDRFACVPFLLVKPIGTILHPPGNGLQLNLNPAV